MGGAATARRRRFQPRSATGVDRLAQPLHDEFEVLRLQMAPALELGLVPLVREALVIFPNCLPGGRALLGELLADEGVSWHRTIKAPRAAVGNRPIEGLTRESPSDRGHVDKLARRLTWAPAKKRPQPGKKAGVA